MMPQCSRRRNDSSCVLINKTCQSASPVSGLHRNPVPSERMPGGWGEWFLTAISTALFRGTHYSAERSVWGTPVRGPAEFVLLRSSIIFTRSWRPFLRPCLAASLTLLLHLHACGSLQPLGALETWITSANTGLAQGEAPSHRAVTAVAIRARSVTALNLWTYSR